MLTSSLGDYIDTHIFIKGTITVLKTGKLAASNNRNKKVIFKNFTPFTGCISQMNNTEIDHDKVIDVIMSMYNLIEQ